MKLAVGGWLLTVKTASANGQRPTVNLQTSSGLSLARSFAVMASKYSKKASKKVEKVMRERKRGTLRSGGSGKKVTSRKQAIAIGLSEARRAGAKVPKKKSSSKKKK